jgi:hypothetical protein
MRGAILLLPQYALMEWCLVKHRDNFTFYIIIIIIIISLSKRLLGLRIVRYIANPRLWVAVSNPSRVINACPFSTTELPCVGRGFDIKCLKIQSFRCDFKSE